MPSIDQYKHLNKKNELGVNAGIEEMAEFVVSLNYGTHRFLSAMVHELRKQECSTPISDGIEKMLNDGMYY